MNTERIKEIQAETGLPDSVGIQQALLQVWNETEQDIKTIRIENTRLSNLIACAINALRDSILVSGNDAETNLYWVRKMERELEA